MSSLPGYDNSSALIKQFGRMNKFENPAGFPPVLAAKHPEPYISISAQALVQDNCHVHMGMVRKENKIRKWQDRYLVLHKGCLYYFKDSYDKKAQGQFSLSGYRLSKAPEKNKFDWTFKLIHIQPEKRPYFFAAHSEKELNEWMEKIQENISEYCETRRTAHPHNDGSSGEENEESYDYPIVEPTDIDKIKEKIIKESRATIPIPSSSSELYCPPQDIFISPDARPKPVCPPRPPQFTKSLGMGSPKNTVDISKVMGINATVRQMNRPSNQAHVNAGEILNLKPKALTPPAWRRRDQTASSSQESQKAVPTPKPRKTAASVVSPSSTDSTQAEEMYLELQNDQPEEPVPRLSTLQRKRPDGHSFKDKKTEAPSLDGVLPPSAQRLDYNKTHAIPLLIGYDGAYMIHSSRKGDINQALSVCIGDKVKHFLIFNSEETGFDFALDPKGPYFKSTESMLKYYYDNPLPNQDTEAFLRIPYK